MGCLPNTGSVPLVQELPFRFTDSLSTAVNLMTPHLVIGIKCLVGNIKMICVMESS